MEKTLAFAFLLCLLQTSTAFASGIKDNSNTGIRRIAMDLCESPPPDSFRITGLGPGFITVAWNPITPGDNHVLTIYRKNVSNGWDTLQTTQVNNGTTYTATGIDHSKEHKLEIRTLCSNGESGTISPPIFPPHGLILELVVGGRAPSAPQPVNDCLTPVSYLNNDWVGFRLTKTVGNTEISSLFEFVKLDSYEPVAIVKRVCDNSPLVAANEDNNWPTSISGAYPTNDYKFKIGDISGGIYKNFGVVNVEIDKSAFTVSLCPEQPIAPPHTFQFLYANSTYQENSCNNHSGNGNQTIEINNSEVLSLKVQNPVSDFLYMFFTASSFSTGNYQFVLMDINGKIVMNEKSDVPEASIAIPLPNLASGVYILRINHNGIRKNLKVYVSK